MPNFFNQLQVVAEVADPQAVVPQALDGMQGGYGRGMMHIRAYEGSWR